MRNPDAELFNYSRDILHEQTTNLGKLLFGYLPLYEGEEYATGLSAYISNSGIVGLESHFRRVSRLSGCRNGCAIYFPLYTAEHISHVWLRIVHGGSNALCVPTLTVSLSSSTSTLLTAVNRFKQLWGACIPLGHIFFQL